MSFQVFYIFWLRTKIVFKKIDIVCQLRTFSLQIYYRVRTVETMAIFVQTLNLFPSPNYYQKSISFLREGPMGANQTSRTSLL